MAEESAIDSQPLTNVNLYPKSASFNAILRGRQGCT